MIDLILGEVSILKLFCSIAYRCYMNTTMFFLVVHRFLTKCLCFVLFAKSWFIMRTYLQNNNSGSLDLFSVQNTLKIRISGKNE